MDCVQVALRIRPLISSETEKGSRSCIEKVDKEPQVAVGKNRHLFTFNYVFDENDSQATVYDSCIQGLVKNLFLGYNVTILAYGQTGSGKTYTMGTNYTKDCELGVIARAVIDIFDTIQSCESNSYEVKVSYLELYKENLFDLLTTKPRDQSIVDMRENTTGICMPGLTEVEVSSADETLTKLQEGSLGRVTGATAMNAQSSRSHAIFTINIKIIPKNDPKDFMTAKFHLVDLAGSERSKKTEAKGLRFQEGVQINKGLLVLGNVISQLGEGNHAFINYRDSKLTRLLQDSLGGNSVTLMIACVSPADYNQDETLSTLRYADRARKIKNRPVVNQDPQAAEIARLRKEIEEYRLKVVGEFVGCPPEHKDLEAKLLSSLKKNKQLSGALGETLAQNTHLLEQSLLVENNKDRLKLKLDEICTLIKKYSTSASHQDSDLIVEFTQKLNEMQEEISKTEEALLVNDRHSIKKSDDNEENEHEVETPAKEEHVLSQAKLNKEIRDLSINLLWKQDLVSKLSESSGHMEKIQDDSQMQIDELKEQIMILEKDKEVLLNQMKQTYNTGSCNAAKKLAELRRKKLQEVEQKHNSLKIRVVELERLLKVKEKSDEKMVNLRNDIMAMKQMKVKLIHQLRLESEKFRTWKAEKDREMSVLKSKDSKKQSLIAKMEYKHSLQQNVLRRKLEAYAAANKRMMEALDRRKIISVKKGKGPISERVKEDIMAELEIVESTYHAQKSLDTLIHDRTCLKKELILVKEQLENNQLSSEHIEKLKLEEKQLEDEVELRSTQIADLQEKLIDSDIQEKGMNRWDLLQTMGDAKFILNFLFLLVAELKKVNADTTQNVAELKDLNKELVRKQKDLENKLEEMNNHHKSTLDRIEKEYEDKIYLLLRQIGKVKYTDEEISERFAIQEQELQKMDAMRNEITFLKQKCAAYECEIQGKTQVSSFQDAYCNFAIGPGCNKLELTHASKRKLDNEEVDEPCTSSANDENAENVPEWARTPIYKLLQTYKEPSNKLRKPIESPSDNKRFRLMENNEKQGKRKEYFDDPVN